MNVESVDVLAKTIEDKVSSHYRESVSSCTNGLRLFIGQTFQGSSRDTANNLLNVLMRDLISMATRENLPRAMHNALSQVTAEMLINGNPE